MADCSLPIPIDAGNGTCDISLDPLPSYEPFTVEELRSGTVVWNIVVLIYMFMALAIVCDEYFVPSLEVMTDRLGLSPDVAGATLMAAGGSMPELFTSLLGTFQGSNVGFGTIVGSAVFNVLFVIGCCAIFAKETLHLTWWPLFRDCVYYCISLLMLALFFGITTCKEIHWYEALILLLMYVIYCVIMKFNENLRDFLVRTCCKKKKKGDTQTRVVEVVTASAASDGSSAPSREKSLVSTGGKDIASRSARATSDAQASAVELGDSSASSNHMLERSNSFRSSKVVDTTFKRPMSVRVGVLTAFIDESPFLSSSALFKLKSKKAGVREIFDQIDKDSSGFIESSEVKELLERLWERPVHDAEIAEATAALDTDQDSKVSFAEFSSWWLKSDMLLQKELDDKFDALDANGDGQLTPAELRPLLKDVEGLAGADVDDAAIAAAMEEIENMTKGSNSGTLSKSEFGAWYKASLFWEQQKKSAEKVEAMQAAPNIWKMPDGGIAVKVRYLLIFPIFFVLAMTIFDVRNPKREKFFVLSFLTAIAWIGVFSFIMVWMATSIGVAANIPSVVMGLTFLAAGTSIPDLLTSVIVAKQGEGDMAVSSSIGSNIFDVLIGLPFPWFIYTLVHQTHVSVTADSLFTSVIVLFLMLAAVVTTIAACGWRMTKGLGGVMFFLYGLFVLQDLFFQFCIINLPDSMKPCSQC